MNFFLLIFELIVLLDELAYNSILQNYVCRLKISGNVALMFINVHLKFEVPNRSTKKLWKNREKTVQHEKIQKMVNIPLVFYQNAQEFLANID